MVDRMSKASSDLCIILVILIATNRAVQRSNVNVCNVFGPGGHPGIGTSTQARGSVRHPI